MVDDFLVTDRNAAERLEATTHSRPAAEKLLVMEHEDELGLALFIDAGIIERLHADDPLACLHEDNLGDFLTALEGVSHFVCVIWNAGHARSVTRLELELQAEIDKYIIAALLIARQQRGRLPRALRRHLFDALRLDPALSAPERHRYRCAHDYAGRYCRHLEQRYAREFIGHAMLAALRRFYRLSQAQKFRLIESLG